MKRLLLILTMAAFMSGSIYAGTIHVTYPNGKETLCSTKPCTITWTSSGITLPLRIVLVKNGARVGDIVTNLASSKTSYTWTNPGSYIGGTAPTGNDYKIRVRVDTSGPTTEVDDSDAFFTIAISNGPFALTAPNGGESWERGSTQDITWSPGCAYGSVRLTLYKGGTDMKNRLNAITVSTRAERGKYSWKVGEYLGNVAQEGEGYYIVVTSYTPEMKDASNGPFTIVKGKLHPVPAEVVKCFGLTYPRRGDRLRKGNGYYITWTGPSCKDQDYNKNVKMRLDLLTSQTQNLVMNIGQNLPNNGKLFWPVPVLELPDDGFYKMRIQTMDGKYSDMVGPFAIEKAKPSSLPAAIKVTAPGGPGTPAVGITYPIRWTSTCGTSANGPVDDGFIIDLMDATGKKKIDNLLDGYPGSYDGESPAGVHNWHWDWPIAVGPGHYRIRVTNLSGHCVGLGQPFQLVYPRRIVEFDLKPSYKGWGCVLNATHLYPMPTRPQCRKSVDEVTVGYDYFQYQDTSGYNEWHGFLDRGQMVFPMEQFKIKGKNKTVKEAILHLHQQSAVIQNSSYASCAGKVFIMNGPWLDCWNVQTTFLNDLPHDHGDIDVNLTSVADEWVKGTLANNGILLTSSDESFIYVATTCKSCYKASLHLKIDEEYDPSNPGQ